MQPFVWVHAVLTRGVAVFLWSAAVVLPLTRPAEAGPTLVAQPWPLLHHRQRVGVDMVAHTPHKATTTHEGRKLVPSERLPHPSPVHLLQARRVGTKCGRKRDELVLLERLVAVVAQGPRRLLASPPSLPRPPEGSMAPPRALPALLPPLSTRNQAHLVVWVVVGVRATDQVQPTIIVGPPLPEAVGRPTTGAVVGTTDPVAVVAVRRTVHNNSSSNHHIVALSTVNVVVVVVDTGVVLQVVVVVPVVGVATAGKQAEQPCLWRNPLVVPVRSRWGGVEHKNKTFLYSWTPHWETVHDHAYRL